MQAAAVHNNQKQRLPMAWSTHTHICAPTSVIFSNWLWAAWYCRLHIPVKRAIQLDARTRNYYFCVPVLQNRTNWRHCVCICNRNKETVFWCYCKRPINKITIAKAERNKNGTSQLVFLFDFYAREKQKISKSLHCGWRSTGNAFGSNILLCVWLTQMKRWKRRKREDR